jgi:hypothetical protein
MEVGTVYGIIMPELLSTLYVSLSGGFLMVKTKFEVNSLFLTVSHFTEQQQ